MIGINIVLCSLNSESVNLLLEHNSVNIVQNKNVKNQNFLVFTYFEGVFAN